MPDDKGKGGGGGGGGGGGNGGNGGGKKPVDVLWLQGWVLYFKNKAWGQNIYDAIWVASNFRVIVDGNVVISVPKAVPGSHNNTHTVLWSNKDLQWDDAGCLVILDKKLGDGVVLAHNNGAFDIAIPGAQEPIGEQKINAMCPC